MAAIVVGYLASLSFWNLWMSSLLGKALALILLIMPIPKWFYAVDCLRKAVIYALSERILGLIVTYLLTIGFGVLSA